MELTLQYDKESDIIIIKALADITAENIRISSEKAIELSKKHHCNNLLIDLSECPIGQSLIDGFWSMQDMEKSFGLSFKYNCAVIYNPKLYPDDRAQFIENVVANRINPILKMFSSAEEARKWLEEKRQNTSEDNTMPLE